MTRITWDEIGSRRFDVGVDRGVFYNSENVGTPWNGLTSVQHKPSGGKISAYYIDGVKYFHNTSPVEFEGSIEAYTYPDEFMEYDGWAEDNNGLRLDQQVRKEFGLSYRTIKGNDLKGTDYGYLIHLVYNVMVEPTDPTYDTLSGDVDPISFDWSFSSRAVKLPGLAPLAHLMIDSTNTSISQLRNIEELLYGTKIEDPKLPTIAELISMFDDPFKILWIEQNKVSGLSPLLAVDDYGDLEGRIQTGLYDDTENTRLTPTETPGLYTLE